MAARYKIILKVEIYLIYIRIYVCSLFSVTIILNFEYILVYGLLNITPVPLRKIRCNYLAVSFSTEGCNELVLI